MPAWGGGLLDNYGLHSVLEWTSSLYAYPIAAFARILAEDPAVRARYECNIIVVSGLQAVAGPKAAVPGLQAAAPGMKPLFPHMLLLDRNLFTFHAVPIL